MTMLVYLKLKSKTENFIERLTFSMESDDSITQQATIINTNRIERNIANFEIMACTICHTLIIIEAIH